MVCVSRSRLGRGGLTQFCINFCDTEQEVISDKKKSSRNGSGSHVPIKTRYTDYLRPSNRAARTLSLVVHMLSQVWSRSVSCEARNHGSGEVRRAKSTLFVLQAVKRNDASLPSALLAAFSKMKGRPVLFSVF